MTKPHGGLRHFARLLVMQNFPTWSSWHPYIRAAAEEGYLKRIYDPAFIERVIDLAEVAQSIWSPERIARMVSWFAITDTLLSIGADVARVLIEERNGAPMYSADDDEDKEEEEVKNVQ